MASNLFFRIMQFILKPF